MATTTLTAGERQERRAPRRVRRNPEPRRHAQDRGKRERRGHDARGGRPARKRHQIGDDREHETADDPAERAGDDSRQQQHRIVRREAAERGGDDEPAVEHRQHALVVESIYPECSDEPARRGGERVGRDQQAELPRAKVEDPHQLRPSGIMIMKSTMCVNCTAASVSNSASSPVPAAGRGQRRRRPAGIGRGRVGAGQGSCVRRGKRRSASARSAGRPRSGRI